MAKRLEILQTIDSTLANITTANGYNTDLAEHSYGFKDYSQVNNFPSVFLLPGDSQYTPLTNQEYTAGSSPNSESGWLISVVGYVKSSSREDKVLTQNMENLIDDIVKAMLSDHRLGLSYVVGVYLVSINSYIDVEQSIGIAQIIFSIKYDFQAGAP